MTRKKRGKLFYKLLFIFLVVSLLPLGIVSYYLVNLTQTTLNKSIIRDQEALALAFADTVTNYVISFRNILYDSAHLEDFYSMNTEKVKALVNNMMQIHSAFLEMSVLNPLGQEVIRVVRYGDDSGLRDFLNSSVYQKTIKSGEFIGGFERYKGRYPAITIAVSIVNPKNPNYSSGILMAKLSLATLSGLLKASFPDANHTRVAVIDVNGFIVAHSVPEEAEKPNAKLNDEILKILLGNDAKSGGGEIILQTGERVLGAFSTVSELDWIIYIERSINVAYQASQDMLSKTWKVMIFVTVFVLFLGYAVSVVITQPIQALREAAAKIAEGNFDFEPDLIIPNDEIGELAHTFLEMSESLKIKTSEILLAKEQLEKLNRTLENRVEARTRELKSAQEELIKKERLAAMGQMASVVSHEIRNPLAVMNNSIYFIKTKLGTQVDAKISKHISIIESEIRQANGIIDEILSFARTRELKPKLTHLNSYLEDLVSTYPFPQHIELEKKFYPSQINVNIDQDEMNQVIRNLIKNAIEVMPERGKIIIRTDVTAENMAKIEIEDSGPGIPKDVLEKLFTPFFTTKARGTGLGLAVVKKVIERHKGKVEIISEVGKGTCFKLYLPISNESLQQQNA
ncbi:MAG TPA: ATP-binding protein [Elusimicrobiales bacterium]|nr:ATP-binding protein [Elusimicrobiales bacterium]HOL61941.1 ATP-binding protein [Elusimicrobiales bacterium]HPO95158.1 ATP-binding protein [Elusimicrobiales bacterium]